MKTLHRVWALLALLVLAPWVNAAQSPYALINQVANATFEKLAKIAPEGEQRAEQIRLVVQEELMPHVDVAYAAFSVLGKHAKNATPAQRSAFVAAFETHLSQTYSQALNQYKGQQVNIEPERTLNDEKRIGIKAQFVEAGREPINLEFRLRKHSKTGQWLAYDLIAEGVSLLSAKRSEFDGLLRTQGIEHVTQLLRDQRIPVSDPVSENKA